MANPVLSSASSDTSSIDDFEGHAIRECREAREAAERGLQDGPHQIPADSRPDDMAMEGDESDPIIISDDDATDVDELYGKNMEPCKFWFHYSTWLHHQTWQQSIIGR